MSMYSPAATCMAVSKPIALSIKGSITIRFIPAKINPDIAPEIIEIKIKVNDFIRKYIREGIALRVRDPKSQTIEISTEDETLLNNISEIILKETRGHPIMVKFLLLRDGLRTDVENKYRTHCSAHPNGGFSTVRDVDTLDKLGSSSNPEKSQVTNTVNNAKNHIQKASSSAIDGHGISMNSPQSTILI